MKSTIIISILLVGFIFVNIIPDASAGIFSEPTLNVQDLVVEKYVSNLCCMITTMTFVEDDILILQKSDGVVRLIQDGVLQDKPVLDVNVDPAGEKGMLGITSVGSSVYLYFTEADKDGGESLGNKIYKYEWDGDSLINPILLKELPSNVSHNGGAMVAGLDDQVYAVIGDTLRYALLQNKPIEWLEGDDIDFKDNGVILQLETEKPYFAMGIRNSFGLAIDPVTGNLWATENGDDDFDEINLIPEKFNSGWIVIMGPATESELASLPGYEDYVYEDPKFTWEKPVAPTGLDFAKFQETNAYDNSLFVGDCNTGNLYNFELNENRDGFEFTSSFLQDKVINKNETMDEIIIGTGFGCITDIERGPDGFLYVVSLSEGEIYRIIPNVNADDETNSKNDVDSENTVSGVNGTSAVGVNGTSAVGVNGTSAVGVNGTSAVGVNGTSAVGVNGTSAVPSEETEEEQNWLWIIAGIIIAIVISGIVVAQSKKKKITTSTKGSANKKFCRKCGSAMDKKSKFCGKCGTSISPKK